MKRPMTAEAFLHGFGIGHVELGGLTDLGFPQKKEAVIDDRVSDAEVFLGDPQGLAVADVKQGIRSPFF